MRVQKRGFLCGLVVTLVLMGTRLSVGAAVVEVARTVVPPKIDGRIDDACWEAAKPVRTFFIQENGAPAQARTAASVLYDDSAIYIGVRCEEPDVSLIRTKQVPRDGNLWGFDCIEVMLDPECSKDNYFHFAVNPSGSVFDRVATQGGYIGNEQWNGEWQAGSFIGEDFWSCEFAIPFYNLGITSKVKSIWGINICREKKLPAKENSSIAEGGAFNVAGKFAELRGLEVDFSQYAYIMESPVVGMKAKENMLDVQVNVPVQNDTGKERTVQVECWLISPSGKTHLDRGPVSLPDGKKQTHTAQFSLAEQGEYNCYLCISTPDTKKMLAFSNSVVVIRYVPMAVRVIEPWYRDAIFETQKIKEVVFDVEIRFKPEELKDKALEVSIREKGRIEPLVSKHVTNPAEKNRIVFDVMKLPYGRLEIYAQLQDKTGTPVVNGDISYPLWKMPYKKGEVWLDKERRWCIEGKPFFYNGIWADTHFLPGCTVSMYGKTSDMPDDIKLISTGVCFSQSIRNIKPRLQEKRLTEDVLAVYRDEVRRAKDDPALFGYYYMDEPSANDLAPSALEQVYQTMKEDDPYHPVIISQDSLWNVKQYPLCADIDWLHPYPVIFRDKEHNDLSETVTNLEGFVDEGRRSSSTEQAFFYMHAGFNYGDYGQARRRVPTYRELRDDNLLALILGAAGFMQYNRREYHYPELYLGIPHLTKELAYYGKAVLAPKSPVIPKSSIETMKMLVKEVDEDLYLFACNADMAVRKVTISVPGIRDRGNRLNVISENRTINLEEDGFSDDFGPYEVHVYTTSKEKPDLLPVEEICRQIDEANGKRRKPGNLAFQMFAEGDVAVSASSFWGPGSGVLWHVVDGIVEEIDDPYHALIWRDGTPDKFPDYLEVQLPTKQTIGRVVVYPFRKSLKDYAIQAFISGEWKEVVTGTGKNGDKLLEHVFEPVTTDRVRLWITGTNGPYAYVSEMEIYAK